MPYVRQPSEDELGGSTGFEGVISFKTQNDLDGVLNRLHEQPNLSVSSYPASPTDARANVKVTEGP